jgi:hypothetical protein
MEQSTIGHRPGVSLFVNSEGFTKKIMKRKQVMKTKKRITYEPVAKQLIHSVTSYSVTGP